MSGITLLYGHFTLQFRRLFYKRFAVVHRRLFQGREGQLKRQDTGVNFLGY